MRDSRADAAYQRALVVYRDGALEAARRFVVEALAIDPRHEGARALLSTLDSNLQAAPRGASVPPLQVDPTVISTPQTPAGSRPRAFGPAPIAGSRSPAPPPEVTIISSRSGAFNAEPTMLGSPSPLLDSSDDLPPPSAARLSDRTVIRPASPRAPSPPNRGTPNRGTPASKSRAAWWDGYRGQWKNYRVPALAVGVLILAVGVGMGISRLIDWSTKPGVALTIRKPTGGTILGKGINCGTLGSDCSVASSTGDVVELEVRPDNGFVFSGYTGDCVVGGRTVMTGPRTCGAIFQAVPTGSASAGRGGYVFTIAPSTGGTVITAGITCGTLGTECSTTVPEGQQVSLSTMSDEGYAFLRYTGDCGPTGVVLMKGALNCGAIFVPKGSGGPPPPPPGPSAGRRPPKGGDEPAGITVGPPAGTGAPAGTAANAGGGDPGSAPPLKEGIGPAIPVAPPPTPPEVTAKKLIQETLDEYCAAHEAKSPERVAAVFKAASLSTLKNQFRQYKSVKCAFTGPPEFVKLDPTAGTANVKIGVKQVFDNTVGGLVKQETIMVTRMSRPDRDHWVIDMLNHEEKPKDPKDK